MSDDLAPDRLLDRAADVIEERGHCKFIRENAEGRVCLLGALDVVLHGHGLNDVLFEFVPSDARIAATSALYEEVGLPKMVTARSSRFFHEVLEGKLAQWNNANDRTPDEVIDHMRWAAKRLRAGSDASA